MDLGLNRRAAALADAMGGDADRLRVTATRLPGGCHVLDCGVRAEGGLEAGRRLAEICLAGMASVSLTTVELDGLWLPGVHVSTDDPVAACLASQYAGWAIRCDGYFAMGSGPARALSRAENELFERIGYAEAGDEGVLVLESRTLPGGEVAEFVARRCRIDPSSLRLLVAPTASVACSVQVAARSVETGLHKMLEVGFDVRKVRSGVGVCPIAPVARNDLQGIGWTNDCILYGARAYFAVRASDDEIRALAERLPASASRDYGRPFAEIFASYDHDFYKIDRLLFSPAEVTLNNLESGLVVRAGRVNPGVLRASLGLG
jgi:methenyltetrahydromethanopterin cyclohydrolase